MKLHFEPNLDHQLQAIEAVCGLFRGQELCRTEFTVTQWAGGERQALALAESDLGASNRLTLLDEEIQENLADDLRDKERAKIECGRAQFQALEVGEAPAQYVVARTVDDVLAGS